MVYVEPTIMKPNIEHSKYNEYVGSKEKKQDKSQKKK